MGSGSGGSSSSKPQFFKGQKALGNALFAQGGPMWALLNGGPDAGYEAGVGRGMMQLNQNLQQQGLYGSPLGAKASSQFLAQAAMGREQNRLQTLMGSVQPYGTASQSFNMGLGVGGKSA